jgi:hypothetical protein
MPLTKSREVLRKTLLAMQLAIVGNSYRPELHYMRGPGPKTLKARRRRR